MIIKWVRDVFITAFVVIAGGNEMHAQSTPDFHLPKIWNAAFVSVISELNPETTVIITIYKSGDKYLIGRSVSGLPQKWFSFELNATRLTLLDPKEVREEKTSSGVTVHYNKSVYNSVDGFGRYPSVQMGDYK